MKYRFLFFFMALGFLCKAQTVAVEGAQTGIWDADTVRVTGNIQVVDSLVIVPGTTVLFDGFFSISVENEAAFKAMGTETDLIVFTVTDTTGFHIYNKGFGGWNGFQLEKAGRFLLEHCLLEYGKAADSEDPFGGALNINSCEDVEIRNTTFRCNFSREQGGAIYGINSTVHFSDCQFTENLVHTGDNILALYGGAAQFLKCDVTMTGMEFRANDGSPCIGGALSLDSCSVNLDRAVFVDNLGVNGGGLYLIRSNHKECKLSNLLFDNNFTYHFGGGFAVADASPEISNVLVINNESYGVSCNGIFFYGESSPILRNCIVYGNYPSPESAHIDTTEMWDWTFEGFAPEFHNCLIEGGLSYFHLADDTPLVMENNIDADPMFVNAEAHDFHLLQGSPCIDAGDPNVPQYLLDGLDLDGRRRVSNGRIDIGPYEYSGASVPQFDDPQAFVQLMGNPLGSHSALAMELEKAGIVLVKVYSMTGQCVVDRAYEGVMGYNSLKIGALVDRLDHGIYWIEVVGNDKKCTLKAVK